MTTTTSAAELRGHVKDWRYPGLSPDRRRELRERKLRAVVREAAEHVPLYREAFRTAGLRADDIQSLDDLDRLPVIERATLAGAPVDDRLSRRAARADLSTETSSGSTGRPLTVRLDSRARRSRNLRFLRALRAVGYRPGHRLLLVTERPGTAWRRRLRWTGCPLTAPPEQLATAFAEIRPHVLYGCATPLRLLAEHILGHASDGLRTSIPRAVVTTAEMLDATTRQRLGQAFGCPVYDLYGLSEVGLVGAEGPGLAGYAVAEAGLFIELIPSPHVPGLARIVVTDLDAVAMPFLRYDTGDLALVDRSGGIVRIDGRSVDCLRLPNGRRVSPYAVTHALERVCELRRYRVVQTECDAVQVMGELGNASPELAHRRIETALRPVLGDTVRLRFQVEEGGSAATRRRLVECQVRGRAEDGGA